MLTLFTKDFPLLKECCVLGRETQLEQQLEILVEETVEVGVIEIVVLPRRRLYNNAMWLLSLDK